MKSRDGTKVRGGIRRAQQKFRARASPPEMEGLLDF